MDKLSNLNFVLLVKYLDHPEHRTAVCVTTVLVSRKVHNIVHLLYHIDHIGFLYHQAINFLFFADEFFLL